MKAKKFMQPKPEPTVKDAVGTIYRALYQKSASLKRMDEKLVGEIYAQAATEIAVMAVTSGWMTLDELCESIKS